MNTNALSQQAPRIAPATLQMQVDPMLFKSGMRQLAAGVCAVTTHHDSEPHGLLVTAVSSVSAEPAPSLLICVNRSSSTHERIINAGCFCVNLLGEHDVELARQFMSSDRRSRFAGVDWETGITGAPILTQAIVSFDCELEQAIEADSHTICIGRVRDVRVRGESGQPLLYFGSNFAVVRPHGTSTSA
ncbi:flavin reductase family protein [Paraburkholderia sp. SG-MS1]|uniref:flavin reductase family protein n=1 Tax=Paraburkholderia sp. SG-MS1 TaxID=2023741 RepID=UPI00193419CC|nr:flavin reductase family protein [Paraburkholderia sp. SG-MS1]